MKNLSILSCLLSLILCGCITEYEAKRIDEVMDILVVEGVITDNETVITLSRSVNLSEESSFSASVDNAVVFVECDNGTQWQAEPNNFKGRYIIKMGQLDLDSKYRLKIEIEESDRNHDSYATTKRYEYYSAFSYPVKTPEIDSIFWRKRGNGQPVRLYVATHEPEQKVAYFRWSYREDWEVHAHIQAVGFPYYCWSSSNNSDLLLGSTEKTVYGQLADILIEIAPSDVRLSKLYRIIVKQNVVSKRAHDYYTNIRKNSQLNGSIFAPTPSELRGNITCITDPGRPVIGYVEASTSIQKQLFIPYNIVLYEPVPIFNSCNEFTFFELASYLQIEDVREWTPEQSGYIQHRPGFYAHPLCVDCTLSGNTTQKPNDWPNNYYNQ